MRRFGAVDAIAAVAVLFLAFPVVALIARAILGAAGTDAFVSRGVLDALLLSLTTTSLSLLIVVILGTPVALVLSQHRFRGSGVVETIVDLPIVLPPAVAGLALLLVLGRRGAAGDALEAVGVTIPFTTVAVVIAQVFVAAPFFIRTARSGFAAIDRDVLDAARADGATRGQLLRNVMVPLAAPALAAGMVLCWARALGEFGATIMFAGNVAGRTQTLPLLVYSEFQAGRLDESVAAATMLIAAAFAVLLAVRILRATRSVPAELR